MKTRTKALTLGQKLDPRRFTAMSPKMAALVAYVLGPKATFSTSPTIRQLYLVSGLVLAEHEGDVGANDIIGSIEDFRRNWENLITAAELTPGEANFIRVRLATAVTRP